MKKSTRKKINNFIAYINRTYHIKLATIAVIWLGYMCLKWTGEIGPLIFIALFLGPGLFMDTKGFEEEES